MWNRAGDGKFECVFFEPQDTKFNGLFTAKLHCFVYRNFLQRCSLPPTADKYSVKIKTAAVVKCLQFTRNPNQRRARLRAEVSVETRSCWP